MDLVALYQEKESCKKSQVKSNSNSTHLIIMTDNSSTAVHWTGMAEFFTLFNLNCLYFFQKQLTSWLDDQIHMSI